MGDSEDEIEFEVCDDGPGIPASLRESLGAMPVDSTQGGHGVGLYLAFSAAARLGGEIELSSADLDVEPLEGDIVDLGEITAQAFALGLDPYPRSAVSVAGVISEDEAVALRSPFAVLKKI